MSFPRRRSAFAFWTQKLTVGFRPMPVSTRVFSVILGDFCLEKQISLGVNATGCQESSSGLQPGRSTTES
jgi:hypothetical protein